MAIIGSLAAWAIYRVAAGRAAIEAPRRVFAAALAGYISINLAALAAAVEFGVQPLLYHDASGAPLYAPYPLHITIPAMMIGHLTVAGVAEAVITAGVVAWLQRAEPFLLQATAPGAPMTGRSRPSIRLACRETALDRARRADGSTPLGIVAAGSAWGEWSPADFSDQGDPAAHSGYPPATLRLPRMPPAGLERLASLWTAPMPRYAPPIPPARHSATSYRRYSGTGVDYFSVPGGGLVARRAHRMRARLHRANAGPACWRPRTTRARGGTTAP